MERETDVSLISLLEKNNHYHSLSGNNIGTDKEHKHKYVSSFYEEEFKRYQDNEVNLLELGTGHGGSLILWNDFFSYGKIYGVDINNYVSPVIDSYSRITRFTGDGYSDEFASQMPALDIVIDDGPHNLHSFKECIRLFLPKLKENGIMIIEDIPEIEYTTELKSLTSNYRNETFDLRSISGHSDSIMFVIWK